MVQDATHAGTQSVIKHGYPSRKQAHRPKACVEAIEVLEEFRRSSRISRSTQEIGGRVGAVECLIVLGAAQVSGIWQRCGLFAAQLTLQLKQLSTARTSAHVNHSFYLGSTREKHPSRALGRSRPRSTLSWGSEISQQLSSRSASLFDLSGTKELNATEH